MIVRSLRTRAMLEQAFEQIRNCLFADGWNFPLDGCLSRTEELYRRWIQQFGENVPKRGDVFGIMIEGQEELDPSLTLDVLLWWLGLYFTERSGIYAVAAGSQWFFLMHPSTAGQTIDTRPSRLEQSWNQVRALLSRRVRTL